MSEQMKKHVWASAVVLAILSGATATPVAGADTEPQTAAGSATLEEVIVTARKRKESVRDIPTSIDAFTGERLQSLGYSTVEAVLKLSPGVTFESGFSPSSTSIIMRGVTNDSRGVGPRTIGRFYGDVPLTNPSIMGTEPDLDTFDMQSVEVLKGPQGTLFGGSALAGAIRYVPNSPDFERFYGSASVGAGLTGASDSTSSDYALMLNAPISDSFALRFAGSVRNFAGFIDDARTGEKDINGFSAKQGRLMAKWQASDAITVEAQYLKYTGDLDGFNWIEGKVPVRIRTERRLDDSERVDVKLLGAQMTWKAGNFSAVLEASQLKKNRDQFNDVTIFTGFRGTNNTVGQNFLESTDQDAYEFRIVSDSPTTGTGLFSDWQYTAGLFYMKSDQTRPVIINLNLPAPAIRQGGGAVVTAEEKAVYLDVTRRIGDKFELNLGGRYFSQTTKGGTFVDVSYSATAPGGLPSVIPFVPNVAAFIGLKETGFNPKAAVRWFVSDKSTVVASYAKGFRFGGINGDKTKLDNAIFTTNIPIPFTFDSDEIDNWELGLRTTWLDKRVTADITAFLIDWKNLQLLQRAGVFAFTDNLGAAEVRGIEFAVNAALTENWSLLVNASHQNAKITEVFNSPEFGLIASGTTLPQAPKWTGAIQLRNRSTLGAADLDGSITYSYRSSSANNLKNTIPLDAFGTLDVGVSLQYSSANLKPKVSLIAKNITDESAAIFGLTIGAAGHAISLNQPRQVELRLNLFF